MNRQEIIWAIEGHARNARRSADNGDDPRQELVRIKSLTAEYFRDAEAPTDGPASGHGPRMPCRSAARNPIPDATAAVPYRYDIMPYVLAVLADGHVHDSETLREEVGDRMGLSREQRDALRPGSTSQTPEFVNEHAWALVYLQDPRYTRAAGALVDNVDPEGDPESYRITEEGVAAHDARMAFEPKTRSSRRSRRASPLATR